MPAMMSDLQMLQGLFGNAVPSGGLSLLGNFGRAPGSLFSLLGGQSVPGAAPAFGAPQTFGILPGGGVGALPSPPAGAAAAVPMDPLSRATQAGALLNQNAFGTADPQKLGLLASAGFPMFNDPRMIQGFLGTMAMNGDEDAAAQLRAMLQRGFFGNLFGGYGGGMGGMGGNVGGGQSAAGSHETGTTAMDADLAAAQAGVDAASGAASGGAVGGAANEVNAGFGGLY